MCCNTFKIRPVNPTASNRIFCQCGICEDCRKAERAQWSFRLQAELLGRQAQGWKCGFFTLTYSDTHRPEYLIDDVSEDGRITYEPWERETYTTFPCFSRSDVRSFILRLRKYLWKHYKITGISYMICSEYGSNTARPHYHGVISWPPVVDAQTIHALICDLWCDKGFVFPRYYLGGFDSHGYHHKPFEVDCVSSASAYCAKYVCKDVGFWADAIDAGIDVKDRKFRKEYAPFHIQNRGLGQQFLTTLSESQKVDLLCKGHAFAGSDVLQAAPIYFRNKLLFDTHYVYNINTKNRLVRREASDFFHTYKREIYEHKHKLYTAMFDRMKGENYCLDRIHESFDSMYEKVPDVNIASAWSDFREHIEISVRFLRNCDSRDLSTYFLAYYHVPECFRLSDPVESWFNHYTQLYTKSDKVVQSEVTDGNLELLLMLNAYLHNPLAPDRMLVDYVSDFHKSMEY